MENGSSENWNLSTFKEQLHNILQKIQDLNDTEQTEALNYVRKFIETKPKTDNTKQPKVCAKCKKSRITFVCPVCCEAKETKRGLLAHLEISHIGTPITCIKCSRTINSRAAFEWHLKNLCKKRTIVGDGQLKCCECLEEFTLPRTYKAHDKAHKQNNFGKQIQLCNHVTAKHDVKLNRAKFKCSHCEKCFIKRYSLYNHLQEHFPLKVICGECGVISETNKEYKRHFQKHKEQKKWKCSYCSDRFSCKLHYFNHIKNRDCYKCLTCNKKFASKLKALMHKKQEHQIQAMERKIQYPQDLKIMPSKTFNMEHDYLNLKHNKKGPKAISGICDYCGKIFQHMHNLNNHLRRYHGSKLQCKHCDFQTQFKGNFKRHQKLHLDEGNDLFICHYCGKSLSTRAVLIDHINYNHLQEKTLKCDECTCTFKRSHELVRHKATHSNLRPHKCKLCFRSFNRVNHLRRHEMTIHSIAKKTNKVKRLKVTANVTLSKKVNKNQTNKTETNCISNSNPIEYYIITVPQTELIMCSNDLPNVQNCAQFNQVFVNPVTLSANSQSNT